MKRGFTYQEFLLVTVIFGSIFLMCLDMLGNGKYVAKNHSCTGNLKLIGKRMVSYRKNHHGQMPKRLIQLSSDYKLRLACMLSGIDTRNMPWKYYTYAYRFLPTPRGTDVICWDRKPHIPQHIIFTYRNTPRRNVLLVDGKVKTIDEKEFQSLHLIGKVEEIDAD